MERKPNRTPPTGNRTTHAQTEPPPERNALLILHACIRVQPERNPVATKQKNAQRKMKGMVLHAWFQLLNNCIKACIHASHAHASQFKTRPPPGKKGRISNPNIPPSCQLTCPSPGATEVGAQPSASPRRERAQDCCRPTPSYAFCEALMIIPKRRCCYLPAIRAADPVPTTQNTAQEGQARQSWAAVGTELVGSETSAQATNDDKANADWPTKHECN